MPSWTPRQPISFQTGLVQPLPEPQPTPAVRLLVVPHPDEHGPALVSRATAEALGLRGTKAFVELGEGSDCVASLAVVDDGAVADGQLAATPVQRHNLHLGVGASEEFRIFLPPAGQPFELADVEAEVTLLGRPEPGEQGPVQVDARAVSRELMRLHFGSVLAAGEACVLRVGGRHLLLRLARVNTLDAEAQEAELAYHCFRGLLTHETQVYLSSSEGHSPCGGPPAEQHHHPDDVEAAPAESVAAPAVAAAREEEEEAASSSGSGSDGEDGELLPQSLAAGRRGVVLLNARQRPAAGPSKATVAVHTNDGDGGGELFPVRRRLLRPCIALTRAVREEGSPEVRVDVDTLTFDRVLIFLEALALGRQPPAFGLHLCPQLLAAARHLGLRDLEEYAQERLGESTARLRLYSFDEIRALNAGGGCWLILDGMVLDVTRWLPEHPGGSAIVPRQSLNLDCARQFELYHASRESFIYLRQFYMGELLPEDRPLVPAPSPPPSAEFLEQLREFTPWRLEAREAATHLGAKPTKR